MGTKKGLNKITRDENNKPSQISQIFHNKNDTNSLSNNNVFAIHEDSENNLWVGTFGGGLNKIIRDSLNALALQNSYILIRRKVYQIM